MLHLTQGVAAIELNVACPNIPGKPVIAYDFEQLEEVLRAVTSHRAFGKKPLGVKLAPYFDMPHFKRAAEIINKFPVSFVVCINTIGNALIVDVEAEQPLIAPKGGFGGLGGGYVKQTALANVRQMRSSFYARIVLLIYACISCVSGMFFCRRHFHALIIAVAVTLLVQV